jgi:hypothetical protein
MSSQIAILCRRAVIVGVSLAALWPAAAAAAPIDVASDHVALGAYNRYLKDILAGVPAWRSDDNAFVASVARSCRGALASLKHRPASRLNRSAVVAFGLELGGDLDAAGYAAGRGPLATMAATLGGLTWSSATTHHTVKVFLAAQHNLFSLAPSHLCADMRALAASRGQRTPRGTSRWLSKFLHRLAVEEGTGSKFISVLERFESASDLGLIADTNRVLRQSEAAIQTVVKHEAHKLVAVLGL